STRFFLDAPAGAVSSFVAAQPASNSSATTVALYSFEAPSGSVSFNLTAGTNAYDVTGNANDTVGVLYPNAPPPRTANNPFSLPGLSYPPGRYAGTLALI